MRQWKSGLLVALAVVTCPCHVPIVLTLLAGTTVGGLLAAHTGLLITGMAFIFVGTLAVAGFLAGRRTTTTCATTDTPTTNRPVTGGPMALEWGDKAPVD